MTSYEELFEETLGDPDEPRYRKTLMRYASPTSVMNQSPPRKIAEAIWVKVDKELSSWHQWNLPAAERLYDLNHYFEIGSLRAALVNLDFILLDLREAGQPRDVVGARAAEAIADTLEVLARRLLTFLAPLAKSTILRESEALYDLLYSEEEKFDLLGRRHLSAYRDACDLLWREGVTAERLNVLVYHAEHLNLIRSKYQEPILELLLKLRSTVEELTVEELWKEYTGSGEL